ncbi:unnamed protein product [Boreogadus saida]
MTLHSPSLWSTADRVKKSQVERDRSFGGDDGEHDYAFCSRHQVVSALDAAAARIQQLEETVKELTIAVTAEGLQEKVLADMFQSVTSITELDSPGGEGCPPPVCPTAWSL